MNQPAIKHSTVIAVINSSEDTVEMLQTSLQLRGFTSIVTGHLTDITRGRTDFVAFLEQHDPKVLIYDISIPYDDNWKFLQLLMSSEEMRGRKVVVTTTNKRVLDDLVGRTDTIEIHGKPYDVDLILNAVEKAAGIVGAHKG